MIYADLEFFPLIKKKKSQEKRLYFNFPPNSKT